MEGISIQSTINAVAAGANVVTRGMTEPYSAGVNFITSLARAVSGGGSFGDTSQGILDQQIKLQEEMLQITLMTNLERTKHEIRMAPARNIRLG